MAQYQYQMPPVSVQEGNAMPRHWIPVARYDFNTHGIFVCVMAKGNVTLTLQSEADKDNQEPMVDIPLTAGQQIWGRWRAISSDDADYTYVGVPKSIDELTGV